ncbi:hypothetical protein, partial [Prescottella equi]|uniref:hypothetical protein n=1 Tax=Rhodococcus hoagii TaxID=43767 RepID=UPI001C92E5D0
REEYGDISVLGGGVGGGGVKKNRCECWRDEEGEWEDWGVKGVWEEEEKVCWGWSGEGWLERR